MALAAPAGGSKHTASTKALANIAKRRRIGAGVGLVTGPHPSAQMGGGLAATAAGEPDADDMPPTVPGSPSSGPPMVAVVPVKAHTRAMPARRA